MRKLSTSLLLPAELADLAASFLRSVTDSGLTDAFVTRITALLTADLVVLNQALTAVRNNKYVEDVAAADGLRDDNFIGFRDLVDSYRKSRNQAREAAYEVIWSVIEKAGTMLYKQGYSEESGMLEALFIELDKAPNQAALATLNATDSYAELKEAQAEFVALYTTKLEEDGRENYPTLAEAKKRIVPHINSFIKAIEVLEETDEEANTALLAMIDATISAIMATARSRKTRGAAADDTTETPPEQ